MRLWPCCALALAACSEEQIQLVETPDLGPRIQLPLQPGDRFTYTGQISRRESSSVERQTSFRLEWEVVSVEDNLDRAPTILTLQASGESTGGGASPDPWRGLVDDFDSWVARMAPTSPDDSVDTNTVRLSLTDAPRIPPPPTQQMPKVLPQPETFFLDVRRLESIRADWLDRDGTEFMDQGADGFILRQDGPAPLNFHDVGERQITLSYSANGVLQRVDERLGPLQPGPSQAQTRAVMVAED